MATVIDEDDRISLSKHDVQILGALLVGNMKAYQIATQCLADNRGSHRMSNGTLKPALRSLEALLLVSRKGGFYNITALGKQVLSSELERSSRQIRLAQRRLKK